MKGKLVACFAVIGIYCLIGIQAKIVFVNGTEAYKGKFSDRNITTKGPIQTWYSVFNPRNISNHSGFMTSVHRKDDVDEDEVRIDEEKEPEVLQNDSLATRSARQLGLFYAQRIMNGLHLLALLAGIYLMIFVVEPVAVPNRLLSQHYFGVPWIPERSTYPLQYNPTLEVISASTQTHTDVIDLKRKDFESPYEKRNSNTSHYHMDTISPSYPFLLSNYSEKPLSVQAAHTKHKAAQTSTYHWHRWSSKPILNQRSRVTGYNGTIRNLQHSRNNQISRRGAEMKTMGSVKSVDISEVLH